MNVRVEMTGNSYLWGVLVENFTGKIVKTLSTGSVDDLREQQMLGPEDGRNTIDPGPYEACLRPGIPRTTNLLPWRGFAGRIRRSH